MIEFEGVGLRYNVGPEVLSDVSFRLEPGSFTYLAGGSGAGKTSVLSLLNLSRAPTRGLITMFGENLNSLKRTELVPVRRKIGMVFQDFRLLDHLNIFDNVALPLRIMQVTERDIRENVEELLTWVGLGSRLASYPQSLSGGEQQRVAIARAIIGRPHLLLADEPTGNLDENIGMKLVGLFNELHKMGTTIVLATHNKNIWQKFPHPRLELSEGHVNYVPVSDSITRLKETGS
jgi:cell division transport system ATP-binding protein